MSARQDDQEPTHLDDAVDHGLDEHESAQPVWLTPRLTL